MKITITREQLEKALSKRETRKCDSCIHQSAFHLPETIVLNLPNDQVEKGGDEVGENKECGRRVRVGYAKTEDGGRIPQDGRCAEEKGKCVLHDPKEKEMSFSCESGNCPGCITEKEEKEICKFCSTERKVASEGTRYLCNHFSEFCPECIKWRDEQGEKENECSVRGQHCYNKGTGHTCERCCFCSPKSATPKLPEALGFVGGGFDLEDLRRFVNEDRKAINQLIRYLEARK